jgi:hypothetical protein
VFRNQSANLTISSTDYEQVGCDPGNPSLAMQVTPSYLPITVPETPQPPNTHIHPPPR